MDDIPRGIILDEPYSNAIIRQGYRENLVDHYLKHSPYQNKYSKSVLNKALNQSITREALSLILLFGKAKITEFDNFNINKLDQEDFAAYITPLHRPSPNFSEIQSYYPLIKSWHKNQRKYSDIDLTRTDFNGIARLLNTDAPVWKWITMLEDILAFMNEKDQWSKNREFIRKILDLENKELDRQVTPEDFSKLLNLFEGDLETILSKFSELTTKLMRRTNQSINPQSTETMTLQLFAGILQRLCIYTTFINDDKSLSLLSSFQQKLKHWMDLESICGQGYSHISNLAVASNESGLPVKTNLRLGKVQKDLTSFSDLPENAKLVYGIWLEEIDGFPRIESFSQLDLYRNNRKVKNFREAFFEWVDTLSAGKPNSEQQLRKKLKKAVEDLKKLENWEHRLGWSAWVSLPVGAISLIAPPYGFILGFIGVGITVTSLAIKKGLDWKKKKKYDWLFLGR